MSTIKEDNGVALERLQKNIDELNKKMNKLSYKIPRFFKKLKYNMFAKKPRPPYGELKDIKSIEIQFENCEVFFFLREEISNISFYNIHKNISVCSNAVVEDYEAKDVWIVIPKEIAERKQKVFGFFEEESLLDRLGLTKERENKDITNIYITYNTDEEETISCVWEGDDDYYNPAQVQNIEEDKYLTISISRKNIVGKESSDEKMGNK